MDQKEHLNMTVEQKTKMAAQEAIRNQWRNTVAPIKWLSREEMEELYPLNYKPKKRY